MIDSFRIHMLDEMRAEGQDRLRRDGARSPSPVARLDFSPGSTRPRFKPVRRTGCIKLPAPMPAFAQPQGPVGGIKGSGDRVWISAIIRAGCGCDNGHRS